MSKKEIQLGKRYASSDDLAVLALLGGGMTVSGIGLTMAIRDKNVKREVIFGTATAGFAIGTGLEIRKIQQTVGHQADLDFSAVSEMTHDDDLELFRESIRLFQEIAEGFNKST